MAEAEFQKALRVEVRQRGYRQAAGIDDRAHAPRLVLPRAPTAGVDFDDRRQRDDRFVVGLQSLARRLDELLIFALGLKGSRHKAQACSYAE